MRGRAATGVLSKAIDSDVSAEECQKRIRREYDVVTGRADPAALDVTAVTSSSLPPFVRVCCLFSFSFLLNNICSDTGDTLPGVLESNWNSVYDVARFSSCRLMLLNLSASS